MCSPLFQHFEHHAVVENEVGIDLSIRYVSFKTWSRDTLARFRAILRFSFFRARRKANSESAKSQSPSVRIRFEVSWSEPDTDGPSSSNSPSISRLSPDAAVNVTDAPVCPMGSYSIVAVAICLPFEHPRRREIDVIVAIDPAYVQIAIMRPESGLPSSALPAEIVIGLVVNRGSAQLNSKPVPHNLVCLI